MKYKVTGILFACLMIACALAASALDQTSGTSRYHQHLEAQAPQEPCACGGLELCTHLPIVRIDTSGQEIPGAILRDENDAMVGYSTTASGETEILVRIETVEKEGVWHHTSDFADQSASAWFRIRGNSSRNFDKKSYRIKLVTDASASENLSLPLLGMSPDNDWALHGPFLDKTLMRNYMWMNISAEIMGYAPNVRFCEVILDGEYQGIYVLMETIKEDEYRVDLSDYEPGSAANSYMLLLDAAEEGMQILNNYTWYTHQTEFGEDSSTGFQILYPHPPALPILLRFVRDPDPLRWEYAAISASALARYSGGEVVEALLQAMRSPNWYVRCNASESLEAHQLSDTDLLEVTAGSDRYAREMLLYRLEARTLAECPAEPAADSSEGAVL